ncbi:hypothetical protein GALL_95410 [mine drainage metagenome]|uniref:Spermatogenesis-associated protein 20-like TRX domain-containing protein n=1 Tax=mine drainage metagenome TaxID=410659 RepID=A0A1J5SWH3_9ZZZZ
MYSNKLIHETSPYLLQHAHNPVHWYPWGEEALQKAKAENKPILVSIGYAACHWCHVMERESFEDESTAELMNTYFINIKIDREERPDLDHIYMDAVQSMTGSGGWPLNVFLTSECKPFFGGTYFPPVAAFNRKSWKEILMLVQKAYQEKSVEIKLQAEKLTEHLITANSFGSDKQSADESDAVFAKENVKTITENILSQANKEWGGFGNAPKFPQTFSIQFLLRHYHLTKDENALYQALLSLDKMIAGGIYDQIGGGFSRYSTDAKWFAPHFEKMLYDNALLIGVLSEAYQLTKKELYAETIHRTMQFIEREMLSDENGFYSALDADSEGVEGKFYTWSKIEIEKLLQQDASMFCELYDVEENGNWEHTNILWLKETVEKFAAAKGIDLEELKIKVNVWHKILMNERNKRVRPQTDDKILLGWNALMNVACCKAFAATGEENYRQTAIKNMYFLEERFATENNNWHHTYKNGKAKIPAFLDDYAYLIQAYIHLQEITGNSDYLIKAKEITGFVLDNFQEEESGYFFYTHQHQKDIIVRKKEVYDGATPSGNAVMAFNLYYLSVVFDRPDWKHHSQKIIQSLGSAIIKYPTSFGAWVSVLQIMVSGINEIVIAGNDAFDNIFPMLQLYMPNKVFQSTQTEQTLFPLLKGKFNSEKSGFFLCKNYVCNEPIFDMKKFLQICNS